MFRRSERHAYTQVAIKQYVIQSHMYTVLKGTTSIERLKDIIIEKFSGFSDSYWKVQVEIIVAFGSVINFH